MYTVIGAIKKLNRQWLGGRYRRDFWAEKEEGGDEYRCVRGERRHGRSRIALHDST